MIRGNWSNSTNDSVAVSRVGIVHFRPRLTWIKGH